MNSIQALFLGQLYSGDLIVLGIATLTFLALLGAAIYIGARARAAQSAVRHQRRRDRRASSGSSKDFFQLDMTRYESGQLIDSAEVNPDLVALPNQDVSATLAWKPGTKQPLPLPDAIPGKADMDSPLGTPRSKLNVVHRKLSLPTGMMRIMDVLKKNRHFEFTELDGRQNRLGAPCTGGLFAEVHFGRSEEDSVLHGLLNPD